MAERSPCRPTERRTGAGERRAFVALSCRTRRDSNPLHSDLQSDALPNELLEPRYRRFALVKRWGSRWDLNPCLRRSSGVLSTELLAIRSAGHNLLGNVRRHGRGTPAVSAKLPFIIGRSPRRPSCAVLPPSNKKAPQCLNGCGADRASSRRRDVCVTSGSVLAAARRAFAAQPRTGADFRQMVAVELWHDGGVHGKFLNSSRGTYRSCSACQTKNPKC